MMTKKEQLKVVFKQILTKMSEKIIEHLDVENQVIIDITTNEMIKEVSMRTSLK